MASTLMPSRGIALRGAPDTDIATKEAKSHAVQVMQLELTQGIVDELRESVRGGKGPQIFFGRNPVRVDTAMPDRCSSSSPRPV
jgi:RNA polymerase II elongation factor ELL